MDMSSKMARQHSCSNDDYATDSIGDEEDRCENIFTYFSRRRESQTSGYLTSPRFNSFNTVPRLVSSSSSGNISAYPSTGTLRSVRNPKKNNEVLKLPPRRVQILTCTTVTLAILTLMSLLSATSVILFGLTVASILPVLKTLQRISIKNGLLPYLPQLLFQALTRDSSLDEFMRVLSLRTGDKSKPGFVAKNKYLLLYFIPGADRDGMMKCLSERRRDFLMKRRTLGGMLGIDNFLYPRHEERQSIDRNAKEADGDEFIRDHSSTDPSEERHLARQLPRDTEMPSNIDCGDSSCTPSKEEPSVAEEHKAEEKIVRNAVTTYIKCTLSRTVSFLHTNFNYYSPMVLKANVGILALSGLQMFRLRSGGFKMGGYTEAMFKIGMGSCGSVIGSMALLRFGFQWHCQGRKNENKIEKDEDNE